MIENFEKVSSYSKTLFEIRDEKILEIENKAIKDNIPIITREVLKYMIFMANSINSKNILEIGTAVGYSSIFLAEICKKNGGRLTTIEIDEKRFLKSIENFKKMNLSEYIEGIKGDALDILPRLSSKYDFIFIDASKSKYEDFFKISYELLNDKGIIFIDNLLFRGYVCDDEFPKRYKTIVNRLKNFITYLNSNYNFVLLPFGDGVGIIKK